MPGTTGRSEDDIFVRDLASGLPTPTLAVTAVPRELGRQEDIVPLVTSLAAWPSDTQLCGYSVSPGIGVHQPQACGLPVSHLEDAGLQMSSISSPLQ